MKLCVNCQSPIKSHDVPCSVCDYQITEIDGFPVLSLLDVTQTYDDYDPGAFEWLYRLEVGNFWFKARNDIILWAMKKFTDVRGNFFEIGCGTGYVLSYLHEQLPELTLSGSDLYVQTLPYAQKRFPDGYLFQMDARNMPYQDEFDAAGMFDVLEHIEEDEHILSQTHLALKPGGKLLITVPQHPFLWSDADEYAHHKRRYTRQELVDKVERANYKVLYVGSFVSLLLPIMMLVRLFPNKESGNRSAESMEEFVINTGFDISPTANRLLYMMMQLENRLIQMGISFAAGGSLLMVAEALKPANSPVSNGTD